MRAVILSSFAFLCLSGSALAETSKAEPAPKPVPEFELPSQAEIDAMIDKLPDFNGILGDMMKLAQDDDWKERMERSGDIVAKRLDESGALEPDANGLPDIKMTLKVLFGAMSDEDVTSGLTDTLTELQGIMEKHMPEETDDTAAE